MFKEQMAAIYTYLWYEENKLDVKFIRGSKIAEDDKIKTEQRPEDTTQNSFTSQAIPYPNQPELNYQNGGVYYGNQNYYQPYMMQQQSYGYSNPNTYSYMNQPYQYNQAYQPNQ